MASRNQLDVSDEQRFDLRLAQAFCVDGLMEHSQKQVSGYSE
jgi:hypothetical protein